MRLSPFTAACAAGLLTLSTPALVARAAAADPHLTLSAARVTVDGTSNVHDWTASTTAVVVTAMEIAGADGDVLQAALQPGAIKAFAVTIPVRGLTSPKEGIDKNMLKALKAEAHPHITFRLRTFEPAGTNYKAAGTLTIAGVEKDVVLDLEVQPSRSALIVTGTTALVMTDYGIKAPSAMLGITIRSKPLSDA